MHQKVRLDPDRVMQNRSTALTNISSIYEPVAPSAVSTKDK